MSDFQVEVIKLRLQKLEQDLRARNWSSKITQLSAARLALVANEFILEFRLTGKGWLAGIYEVKVLRGQRLPVPLHGEAADTAANVERVIETFAAITDRGSKQNEIWAAEMVRRQHPWSRSPRAQFAGPTLIAKAAKLFGE